MKFPKMVKHLLAGEKITRDRWIRENLGYIVLEDDKILCIDGMGEMESKCKGYSYFGVSDMKKKGWRIYHESD